jgi:hypothetical protein
MVEDLWKQVTKKRRNRYTDMVNEAHGTAPLSLEDEEKRDNEWKLPDEPPQSDREWVDSFHHKKNRTHGKNTRQKNGIGTMEDTRKIGD